MKARNPLVSIVIPVYNGSNYLRKAIESALNQTYKNIEIIVVNDGSDDNGATEQIALSYGEKVRYFSKPNGGVATALNLGIESMRGEYFSWLSHDDIYLSEKIEKQIACLAKKNHPKTIVYCGYDIINEKSEIIARVDPLLLYAIDKLNIPLFPLLKDILHGCSLLIHKSHFERCGLFDENLKSTQDYALWFKILRNADICYLHEFLVLSRAHSEQNSRTLNNHLNKCNELWISMMSCLSEDEMKRLSGSKLQFYKEGHEFLKTTPYNDAQKHVEALYTNALEEQQTNCSALDYLNSNYFTNLQISSHDLIGQRFNGHNLHFYLREQGVESKQLVLDKKSNDENTFVFDFLVEHSCKSLLHQKLFIKSDIIHLHLVHYIIDVNYFPFITKVKPTVITLHDPFYLGGNCVHHFDCTKWKTHCADCQNLDNEFAPYNDFSALNFSLKKKAIQDSSITAIVASKWMQQKVKQSPIWKNKKVYYLPFGIDTEKFTPGDSVAAKKTLDIPEDNTVLLFRADTLKLKGFDIIVNALEKVPHKSKITLIAVGTSGLLGTLANEYHVIEFDWVNDEDKMIQLYQTCDIFLMPSRQEAFGFMAIEAMCCGKMVLAIESEGSALVETINSPTCGLTVKEADYAIELMRLLNNKKEIIERGSKCAEYARAKHSKDKYIQEMIRIYREVINNHERDEESMLLYEQLRKYANNNFIQYANKEIYEAKNVHIIKQRLKAMIRFCARVAWKAITIFRLKRFIKSGGLYAKMKRSGIVDKLRG